MERFRISIEILCKYQVETLRISIVILRILIEDFNWNFLNLIEIFSNRIFELLSKIYEISIEILVNFHFKWNIFEFLLKFLTSEKFNFPDFKTLCQHLLWLLLTSS